MTGPCGRRKSLGKPAQVLLGQPFRCMIFYPMLPEPPQGDGQRDRDQAIRDRRDGSIVEGWTYLRNPEIWIFEPTPGTLSL